MAAVLKVEHLRKEYPGVVAVEDMSFELHEGEVLALLGENGAGKSTISKMINGVEKPDAGSIYVDGKEMHFNSAMDAMDAGIHMVHQELSMVGDMSIAENIFFNRQPHNALGMVNWSELYRQTSERLREFDLDMDPRKKVREIPIGTQQLLEILRAISMEGKVVILDEPTSSLGEDQIRLLMDNIRKFKAKNHAFIYISHKLDEVFEIADRVVIMRDGQFIADKPIGEVTQQSVVTMMVGREITQLYGEEREAVDQTQENYFEVKGLTAPGMYEEISFGAKKGEILGISGLIGAGRTEVALGIIGHHKRSGSVFLDGKELKIREPEDAIKNGIGYVTEDRKGMGLYLDYSISDNIGVMQLDTFSKNGMLKMSPLENFVRQSVEDFNVATPSINQTIGNLSGGNQQKVLLAMWMGIDPKVLIVDEPTRGVDVGAKAEIYQMIKAHADKGNTVIVISSELPELIGICDRIVVMHEGRISGQVEKEEFTEDRIMQLASGLSDEEAVL